MDTMTYGEAWYQSKLKVTLQDDERSLRVKEKRMKRKEASKYYNAKLFTHFVEDYSYVWREKEIFRVCGQKSLKSYKRVTLK